MTHWSPRLANAVRQLTGLYTSPTDSHPDRLSGNSTRTHDVSDAITSPGIPVHSAALKIECDAVPSTGDRDCRSERTATFAPVTAT